MNTITVKQIPIALQKLLASHPRVGLAFSGGVDSSYLMYAIAALGLESKAYYVQTEFQPAFEWGDALLMADFCAMPVEKIELSAFENEEIIRNNDQRCYYCKMNIMRTIMERAKEDGFNTLFDGSNADDNADERPGMRAIKELSIMSPLREAGLGKAEIRRLSREAGLFTWDKPAYACLATRIPQDTAIDADVLRRIEQIEDALRDRGYVDFRARVMGDAIKLQVPERQWPKVIEEVETLRQVILPLFSELYLDLQGR